MADIQFIDNDSQVQFHKILWHDSEIVLARCFSFTVDIETGLITALIRITSRKALCEFIRIAFKNFSESVMEENRRIAFFEKLDVIYGTYNANASMVIEPKLPYIDMLYQHQKDVLVESFYRKYNFLAMEMGTGKTITAASMTRIHNIKRTVIVAPAAVKWNWKDDLVKVFGFQEMYFTVLDAAKKRRRYAYIEYWVIVNYDILEEFMEYINREPVGHFIFDEAQKLKNAESGRSKKVAKMLAAHPNAMITFLSGTPISNRVNDIFNYLKMIGHELGQNHKKFMENYTIRTTGRGGERVTGGKSLQDLHTKLSNFMIRRTKAECLDLPDKIFMSYKFELDDYEKQYNEALAEMAKTMKMSTLLSNIHTLNIITAMAKVHGIIELAESIIADGRKLSIFGGYKDPMLALEKHFGERCVRVDGSVESYMRNEHVKEFVSNPDVMVFLGNWDAAGVGINLTNSSDIIVHNYPLTPDKLFQGIDRHHRIGQKNSVNIHETMCVDSIDEILRDLLMDKDNDISAVIDGTNDSVLKGDIKEILIKKLLKKDDITFDYGFKPANGKAEGAQDSTAPEVTGPVFTPIEGEQEGNSVLQPVQRWLQGGGDDNGGVPEKIPVVEIQPRIGDTPREAKYHLIENHTDDSLLIMNEEEYCNLLNDPQASECMGQIFSHEDPITVITHGRHKALLMTGGFDDRYVPNKFIFDLRPVTFNHETKEMKLINPDGSTEDVPDMKFNPEDFGRSTLVIDPSKIEPIKISAATPVLQPGERFVCNRDCPDVEFGNCCHPVSCARTIEKIPASIFNGATDPLKLPKPPSFMT
jgi:superfamily II DNA or RNA helicase